MNKKTVVSQITVSRNTNHKELIARKQAIMAKLGQLFAKGGAHLEPLSALVELRKNGKLIGKHHIDCGLITSDGKTYHFCFGYDRAKEAEHPFFIRLMDNWFEGSRVVAKDDWFYAALASAMNIQGTFRDQEISVSISKVELSQAA